MKRLSGPSVFACLALGAASSTAQARPPFYSTTLRVNDPAGVGAVGDEKLSLAEAIRLANGGLALQALSPAERAQIKGRPGRAGADRILLTLGAGAHITLPAQPSLPPLSPAAFMKGDAAQVKSSLPTLLGNDGDMLDGAGVVLTNGADGANGVGGAGLEIRSSNFTLQNITLRRLSSPISVSPADAGGFHKVVIRGNRIEDGGIVVSGSALNVPANRSSGLTIADNVILGPSATGRANNTLFNQPIAVTAANIALPGAPGDAAPAAVLEHVRIVGNKASGFGSGIAVLGASLRGGRLANVTLRDVLVQGNEVEVDESSVDPAFMLWGAVGISGDLRDVRIENVRVLDNRFVGPVTGVYMTAVEQVFTTPPVEIQNARLKGLKFNNNVIAANSDRCLYSVFSTTVFQEIAKSDAHDNVYEDIEFRGNQFAGCQSAIVMTATLNHATGAQSARNVQRNVRVVDNVISASKYGLMLTGSSIEKGPLVPAAPSGRAQSNRIENVVVSNNRITVPNGTGIGIYGGYAREAKKVVVSGNVASAIRGSGNVIQARTPCQYMDQKQDETLGAEGNKAQDIGIACERGVVVPRQ